MKETERKNGTYIPCIGVIHEEWPISSTYMETRKPLRLRFVHRPYRV